MKKRGNGKRSLSADKKRAGGIVTALAAALAVFAVMLQVEKKAMADYEKGTVYMAVREIPKGQMITEENYGQYFVQRELERSCIADSALRSPEQITGLAAGFNIAPGVLLTEEMFERRNDILGTMKEPVVAGFKADDLYQVVGGTLRAGDRIHIYRVTEGAETILIWDNVYVEEVFDQSGRRIENSDTSTAVQRVNVYLDKGDVETFYSELTSGTLRVVRKID